MKYWFYSEGNILGPHAPGELLTLPAFAQDSLVCLETSAGDNPGDWKPASQVAEIEEALSVGTGKLISSDYGGVGDLYALETGFSQALTPAYESASEQGYSYENLLNTIDGILKTGDGGSAGAPERKSSFNYDLMDKFDIRLAKIQEELEAARWEKNLLLEKIRMKDLEDGKQRDRIVELEGRLKAALGQGGALEKEFERLRQSSGGAVPEAFGPQNGHPEDLTEKAESASSAGPKNTIEEKNSKILKNLRASGEVKLEKIGDSDDAAQAGNGITSGRLKSLGGSAKSLAGFGDISGETLSGSDSLAEDEGTPNQAGGGPIRLEPPPLATPEPKPETLAYSALGGPSATENLEPLPQQAGGLVYDFTVVTSKSAEPFKKVQFNIEAQSQSSGGAVPKATGPQNGQSSGGGETATAVSPQLLGKGVPKASAADSARGRGNHSVESPVANPQEGVPPRQASVTGPQNGQAAQRQSPLETLAYSALGGPSATEVPAFQSQSESPPYTASPDRSALQSAWQAQAALQSQAQRTPDSAPLKQPPPASAPDKTERIVLSGNVLKAEVKSQVKPARKGGRLAFIAVIMIFSAIAAGGLGFFFLGDGLSFSEFSMLDFNSSKRAKKSVMPSQLEPQIKDKNAGQPSAENAAKSVPEAVPGEFRSPATATEQAPEKTAAPLAANEGVKTAIETVKNYKLSGSRGAIGGWFANSFLSGSSGAASEEWSATPLHGDILVVQYRLIRQKQDPLIYQFEVDGAKNDIIRGINNNAIELLDFSSGKTAPNAAPAPKPEGPAKKISAKKLSAKAKPVRKPGKPRGVPILPLPDAPWVGPKNEDFTGFEDAQPENGEKVKYIRAQESDEELF